MPPRPRVAPTDDWDQIELLARGAGQRTYELIRPVVLFGAPLPLGARRLAVPVPGWVRAAALALAAGLLPLSAAAVVRADAARPAGLALVGRHARHPARLAPDARPA